MSVSFRPPFCRLACAILESMRIAVLLLLLSSALASAQQANPDQLFGSAIEAQQRGDYPTAIEDYQKLLKLRPKMVEARVNLGAALAHTGRFDEAIKEYQLALPDVPDKDSVHMNIGLAYYKKGDLADAIGEFKIVQKSRPLDPQLAILLGDSEVRSGKGADAVAMLTPLEAENAGNPDFEYVMHWWQRGIVAMVWRGSKKSRRLPIVRTPTFWRVRLICT
jgi:tetratricopeptide (TPR) repeat protein